MSERARLLEGRVALVSGAGPGLGRALSLALAAQGARVALLARNAERVEALAGEVRAVGAEALPLVADLTASSEVDGAVESLCANWGGVDVLVNNAFALGQTAPFLDADFDAGWAPAFSVNLFGTLRLSHAVAHRMRDAGGGSIVMINTVSVRKAEIDPRFVAYASSKAALRTASRYLAEELGPAGIRVNTVTPGRILGESLLAHLERLAEAQGRSGATLRAEIEAKLPLGRIVPPDEIADAVVFFASDLSRAITGTELDVNGGEFIPS